MTQPRSKYDYPGLPLWDRDGNPVGVGDAMKGAYGQRCEIVEWEGAIGYRTDVWPATIFPLTASCKESFRSHWRLVMPPGFPKDRRVFGGDTTYRFVDEWHGYKLDGPHKGEPFRAGTPCSITAAWPLDADGNPVQAEEPEEVLQPATQEEVNGLLQRQIDQLESRLDALEEWRTDIELMGGPPAEPLQPEAAAEAQRVQPTALPTDPDEWEECETEPHGWWPKFRRSTCGRFVVRFCDDTQGRVVATDETIHPLSKFDRDNWFEFDRKNYWTPVRPRRREVETDPDRELRDWFWENARRIDVCNLRHCVALDWFEEPDISAPKIKSKGGDIIVALRSLREQVEEAERSGQEGGR